MNDTAIDLRSDTVTRPTDAMRAAMHAAAVGDDQYGEDPVTNELQERVAALLGKEAGLWVPSGTMANQIALRVLTRPGDEVIVSRECHAGWHETGGSAAGSRSRSCSRAGWSASVAIFSRSTSFRCRSGRGGTRCRR